MITTHILGFPRIGLHRELKFAVEDYWQEKTDFAQLQNISKEICVNNWALQKKAGLAFVSVGDFTWYDQVLDMSMMLGVIPERIKKIKCNNPDNRYFLMARGSAPNEPSTQACAMTKWFDTNYHYIVPEFSKDQTFELSNNWLFDKVDQAIQLDYPVKPILVGPCTYLWLGKTVENDADKLKLLPKLILVYKEILTRLKNQKVQWVQIDEPILALDLPDAWKQAIKDTYQQLKVDGMNLMLTTYFGGLEENLEMVSELPVAGIHIDAVRSPESLAFMSTHLSKDKILSAGVIDGRNIWRADLSALLNTLKPIYQHLGDRLWIGSACSLQHSPVDLAAEQKMNPEIKEWLAFAVQKLDEITALAKGIEKGEAAIAEALKASDAASKSKKTSALIHKNSVSKRMKGISADMMVRKNAYQKRSEAQKENLLLPILPVTSIGSFPQTGDVRQLRQKLKSNAMTPAQYKEAIQHQIADCIYKQEEIGVDVLVHGEFERNDMVEYFSDFLSGFAISQNGWVQSYGSRCVKPPIIYGDVERCEPMTLEYSTYAQSLTEKPMKGMLTGPTTMVSWSFVRNDQPRVDTMRQIALALRDEVLDLEKAGIDVIQVDEPAFRECLPLRRKAWPAQLQDAIEAFKLVTAGVKDSTQIHTHMCYSEFNDIMDAISKMDADVISIEASRSDMVILKSFKDFRYPNEMGPGIYDVHSPRIPSVDEMVNLLKQAAVYLPVERLWVNPDCGLKTRGWPEITEALKNMVAAAKVLRAEYEKKE